MHAGAVIPTLLPLFIAIVIKRTEARIYRQLADAQAFTAESAVQLLPNRSIEKRRLQHLIRGGAVRLAANGHHFLDADGWNRYQSNRRRRGLLAMSVVLAVVGITFAVLRIVR